MPSLDFLFTTEARRKQFVQEKQTLDPSTRTKAALARDDKEKTNRKVLRFTQDDNQKGRQLTAEGRQGRY
jgi:hypothetical protein